MSYEIILADPCWQYYDKSLNRGGAERHYDTMTEKEIGELNVNSIAAKNCALFLWATWPKMREAFHVMDAWGFEYKTVAFLWVKANKSTEIGQGLFFAEDPEVFWGMGRWTRSNTEPCLLAVKGKPMRQSAAVHQVIYAPIDVHSRKPAETRDRIIKLMGSLTRVELFARQTTCGWDSWGNEVESTISL